MSARLIDHGTRYGYQQHRKAGEVPCDPCHAAQTAYQAYLRFRIGAQHDPRRCDECGSVFGGHTCHALRVAS